MIQIQGKYNSAKIFTSILEETAHQQILELCNQPFAEESKIRIMPDCHSGKGCTIGTTMTLVKDQIVPNLVGVDIGCSVSALNLGKIEIDIDALKKLDQIIYERIPYGFNIREFPHQFAEYIGLERLVCWPHIKNKHRIKCGVGTLGGGNHYIELNKDSQENIYLTIHTGSRNLGLQVVQFYQNEAISQQKHNRSALKKKEISLAKKSFKGEEIGKEIDRINKRCPTCSENLCYVEGESYLNYLLDMTIAQNYASWNHMTIIKEICEGMEWGYDIENNYFQTVHNYIDVENGILRKGATSAQKGELLIIPMNMKDGSLICIGKGNPDWNYSAPRGAGRLMSRAKAKKELNVNEFKATMEASEIYSTSVGDSTLDEAPEAYKPMQSIIDAIDDTVEVKEIIKPLYNFKAH